jgi:hypothetical protein
MDNPLLFSACAFLMVMLLLTWVGYRLIYKPGRFLRQLGTPVITADPTRSMSDKGEPEGSTLVGILRGIGSRVPSSEGEVASLKLDLQRAGFRSEHVLPVFYGLRIVTTLMMLVICIMIEGKMPPNAVMKLGLMASGIGAGWILPRFFLEKKVGKRQEILRPVLEHPRGFVLLSVRAMAKRLGTDPATVVRIVRVLGFDSFREFQKHLHDLSIAFATSADTMQAGASDRGRHAFIPDAIDRDLKNLQALKNTVDAARLTELAKRMYSARRIVLLAGDLAAILASYFEYQTSLLGLPIFSATSAGRIGHLTRSLTKDDLVVAISFRRGLVQTVEGVKKARERGAHRGVPCRHPDGRIGQGSISP